MYAKWRNDWLILTSMSQTEGPQPQVWGSVWDTAQTVLYRVYRLMGEHLTKVKLLQTNNIR